MLSFYSYFTVCVFKVVGADPHRDLLLKAILGFSPAGVFHTTNFVPDKIIFAREYDERKERARSTHPCAPAT